MDKDLAEFLQELAAERVLENSLVVFWSDGGTPSTRAAFSPIADPPIADPPSLSIPSPSQPAGKFVHTLQGAMEREMPLLALSVPSTSAPVESFWHLQQNAAHATTSVLHMHHTLLHWLLGNVEGWPGNPNDLAGMGENQNNFEGGNQNNFGGGNPNNFGGAKFTVEQTRANRELSLLLPQPASAGCAQRDVPPERCLCAVRLPIPILTKQYSQAILFHWAEEIALRLVEETNTLLTPVHDRCPHIRYGAITHFDVFFLSLRATHHYFDAVETHLWSSATVDAPKSSATLDTNTWSSATGTDVRSSVDTILRSSAIVDASWWSSAAGGFGLWTSLSEKVFIMLQESGEVKLHVTIRTALNQQIHYQLVHKFEKRELLINWQHSGFAHSSFRNCLSQQFAQFSPFCSCM